MKALTASLLIIITLTSAHATITQQDIFISGENGYDTYRIPAIIVAADKSILAFCEGRKNSRGDAGDIDLLLKRSTDGGKSWSQQVVVWSDEGNTCGNPCPVVDLQSGKILLLSTWNRGDDHEPQILKGESKDSRRVFVLESSDNGLTWSTPTDITKEAKLPQWYWYATGPGVGIQIQSGPYKGRLVIPCDHSFAEITPGMKYGAHVIYSDDHGKSWNISDAVMPGQNENQVVELSDGRLLMNARNHRYQGSRSLAFSSNGGRTWPYVAYESNLIEPRCQASMIRYRNSDKNIILFSNPNHESKRVNMTVKLSYDNAQTWPAEKAIYAGPSAYSCLAALPNGNIGCFYENGKDMPYEKISLAIFTLEWLTEKK